MKDPNENRTGYKKTKVGWIPAEWNTSHISDLGTVTYGLTVNAARRSASQRARYITVSNFTEKGLNLDKVKEIGVLEGDIPRYALKVNDILLVEGNGNRSLVGRAALWSGEQGTVLHQNHLIRIRIPDDRYNQQFLVKVINFNNTRGRLDPSIITSSGLNTINSSEVSSLLIPVPPLPEQKKISEILSTWDETIKHTRNLLEAKKHRKIGLMQQLLIGKKRMPGFGKSGDFVSHRFFDLPADWECQHMRNIATERSERNCNFSDVTVLACSKYYGFIPSMEYFGKRVFSDDTSNYKVVRRGWFGFPANHVEEGSIGLLKDCDIGIVSPIYIVFSVCDRILPEYLYAVFKTDTYRHIFSISTNASVDRRGSLRWREFGLIRIPIPTFEEQTAIVAVLQMADKEIDDLEAQLEALEKQKRGLMQKLLTGTVRVNV